MTINSPIKPKKNSKQPEGFQLGRDKTGGRKLGAVNTVNATVKDNILAVFNRLDGTAGMAAWARKNLTEFYKLYARLLPMEITATVKHVEVPADLSNFGDEELAQLAMLHQKLFAKVEQRVIEHTLQ